jgi:hypothetical protein
VSGDGAQGAAAEGRGEDVCAAVQADMNSRKIPAVTKVAAMQPCASAQNCMRQVVEHKVELLRQEM